MSLDSNVMLSVGVHLQSRGRRFGCKLFHFMLVTEYWTVVDQ